MSIIGWQTCPIGSSPNGSDPNARLNVGCSTVSPTFNCLPAANCFAVVSETRNDAGCLSGMTWGAWDTSCASDNQRKYWSKLNGITGDPSTWMAACQQKILKKGETVTLPNGTRSQPISSDGTCVSKPDGMYGEVFVDGEPSCAVTKFNDNTLRTYCDGTNQVQYKMCTNWNNNDPKSCDNVKPAGILGWQTCGIGSSPGGQESGHVANVCSARSDTFNCAVGQNCFGIFGNSYTQQCDTTSFGTPLQTCQGPNRMNYQKCENWANNNANSCLTKWADIQRFEQIRLQHSSGKCIQRVDIAPVAGGILTLTGACGVNDAQSAWEFDKTNNTINPRGRRDLCVAWSGRDNSGDNLTLQNRNPSDTKQQWTFTAGGTIASVANASMCMDLPNGQTNDGSRLQLWQCIANNDAQRFKKVVQ